MSPNFPACYVVVKKDDKILFVKRANTGFMDGHYSLPAGRVEVSETFSMGAAREALEEVGLTIKPEALKHVHTQHRYSNKSEFTQWVDVFFEVSDWSGEPINNEPDKHSEIAWLPIADLPDSIMDYQKNALDKILLNESYGEFGWESKP